MNFAKYKIESSRNLACARSVTNFRRLRMRGNLNSTYLFPLTVLIFNEYVFIFCSKIHSLYFILLLPAGQLAVILILSTNSSWRSKQKSLVKRYEFYYLSTVYLPKENAYEVWKKNQARRKWNISQAFSICV